MRSRTASTTRSLREVDVPLGPDVLERVLPAVETALSGGPALLPLPADPPSVRDALLAPMRPDVAVEDAGDPVALVVPTSGSTGQPKGVLLGGRALRASAARTYARLGGPGRWLLALPATHVAGLMVLVRSIVAGTEPVAIDLHAGFAAKSFLAAAGRLFRGDGLPRYTSLVPRQLNAVVEAGGAALEALTSFDAVLVGGSAIPPVLLERARATGVRLVTSYGMTETCGGCVYNGVPLDGVRVETTADRRVRIAGPVLAHGYRLRPDLTAAAFRDGWFTTSDLGRMDDTGRLHIFGRMDDVAVSGGVNVPLPAVDELLAQHPAVAAAAAVAVPDADWGQRIVAAVVAADPAVPPSLESIRAHVLRTAPAAYAPKSVLVVDALPVSASGALDRAQLAARLAASTAR
ncbi:MAG: AMP-binding protein [Jiangellaceae bacterium]|nr:AMP-binding protein [Jiangellaceae bacterium]